MTDLLAAESTVELLYTGTLWGEGPVWLPWSSSLRWSDIPNDRILEFDSRTGETRVHRERVEYTNGRTLDRACAVVQCSHGRRSVEREIAGSPTTIVNRWNGALLNSPNDVVVASDGTIWFTDPPYGIAANGYEGHPGDREYGGCHVFRYDETTAELTAVITDMVAPNGLAFSPDERTLYVSDTQTLEMLAFDVDLTSGSVSGRRTFADFADGASDGFRVDVDGRVWSSAGNGLRVLAPTGEVLLDLPFPEIISNVCFGGADGSDLYLTGATGLYRLRTATRSAG